MAPSRHDWKIVAWDVKPQHNQPNPTYFSILSGLTDWPTYQPILYLGWLTNQHTSLSILVGWTINIPAYLNLTTYLGWLYDQHTRLFTWIDCATNKPVYLSWLTDQQTSLSIKVGWPTNIPVYWSGSTKQQTYLTIYPRWVIKGHPCLPIPVDWLTNIHDYLSSPTDQKHITLSARVDWTISIPAYPPRLTELTYQFTSPSMWVDWQTSLSIWVDWMTNIPAYLTRLIHRHTWPSILVAILAYMYPSGLTDWPTHQSICPGWLTNQHNCISIQTK